MPSVRSLTNFSTSSSRYSRFTELRDILSDIYTDSIFQFVVGRELVTIHPTSGVRQGDGLLKASLR
jgi:hypothetical protein